MITLAKKTTRFVSEVDKMLQAFDQTHEDSPDQAAEIKKYQRIFELRDHALPDRGTDKIWEDF